MFFLIHLFPLPLFYLLPAYSITSQFILQVIMREIHLDLLRGSMNRDEEKIEDRLYPMRDARL